MIVDAQNQILGRLGTFVSKHALLGEDVVVVNCEKAVMTGNRATILDKYKAKIKLGQPSQGPHFPKNPDRFVKRSIGGMVPKRKPRGRAALMKIKCYMGVPKEFDGREMISPKQSNIEKVPNLKYITIQDICKTIGFKK